MIQDDPYSRAPLIPLPPSAQPPTVCCHCGGALDRRDVVAVGMRRTEKQSAVLFAEAQCPHCRGAMLMVFANTPMNARKLAVAMRRAAARVTERDKAFDREAQDRWNQMQETAIKVTMKLLDSHEDFLRAIGLTAQQIEEYGTYRPETDGDDEGRNTQKEK